MDPLNLLKELYGEEPIRKVLSSGFDSLGKIAAATPESLSFFAGIQEALARQIIDSAEEGKEPGPQKARAPAGNPGLPTQPRELARSSPRKEEPVRKVPARSDPMDEHPLLDAGGVLKTLAKEPHPKEFLHDDAFLEDVGLSHAEAGFLEGISPWEETPARERFSPLAFETRPAPEKVGPPTETIEFAPISNWSPESEPDPVPLIVRAPGLAPDFEPHSEPVGAKVIESLEAPAPQPVSVAASKASPSVEEKAPPAPPRRASFWNFGR
jgi:hypothetical protein